MVRDDSLVSIQRHGSTASTVRSERARSASRGPPERCLLIKNKSKIMVYIIKYNNQRTTIVNDCDSNAGVRPFLVRIRYLQSHNVRCLLKE